MKKIWIGFISSIMILMTIVIISNTTLDESVNTYVPLSSQRTNYTIDKRFATDIDGNLKVPYDIAFPEAFKSGAVSYDRETIHIKVLTKDLGVISLNMRNAGIESLTKLFGDQEVTWYEAKVSSRLKIEDVMAQVRALDEILLADYNYTYQKESFSGVDPIYLNSEIDGIFDDLNVSDNPLSAQQWYLDRFGIPEAWAWLVENGYQAGGSEDVVVAVIDTGVDYNHPDLKANMWVNPKEVKNESDTDQNGFVDDIHGASVISDGRFWNGDPMDDHGHGTHVAGIIAAANNKEGIIGIAHNVKIMAVKSGMSSGFFTSSAIAKGIEYAYTNGADVINMSFGGSLPAIAVQDALMLAYTTSVLVASAGNNGLPNEACPPYPVYGPNYPAALSYVVGVMSVGPSLVESSFSNWDCKAYNKFEYEINAPGESMMSTLPNGQYVSWNGTSMAAPVVSAVAALVRSVYNDRDVYPNKFVMGQVNAATTTTATSALGRPLHNIPFVIDAYKALTSLPKPELTLFDYYIYDPVSLSERNNGDGIIDSGETIQIGIVLRNRWGKSENTVITIDTITPTGENIDKVEFINDTVNFGDVGTYSTKDFLKREGSIVTGVEVPHVIKISDDAPNDYIFKLNIRGTYENALDPLDETVYELPPNTFIYLTIRNGVLLPNRISEDMTLTKDNYYILPNSTLIEEGVTVTVEPGTNIQFWSDDPNDAYAETSMTYLEVRGRFIVQGTQEEKVKIFPSQLRDRFEVNIYERNNGFVSISHAEIKNPALSISYLGYSHVEQVYVGNLLYRYLSGGSVYTSSISSRLYLNKAEFNQFRLIGGYYRWEKAYFEGYYNSNLFTENNAIFDGTFENNVFLTNNNLRYQGESSSNVNLDKTVDIYKNSSFLIDNTIGKTYIRFDAPNLIKSSNNGFEDIRKFAQSLGGDLVIIETEEEYRFLRSFIDHAFIGLTFDRDKNIPIWVDGSEYTLGYELDDTWEGNLPRNQWVNSRDFLLGYFRSTDKYLFYPPTWGFSKIVIEVPSNTYLNQILSNEQVINLDLESTYSLLQTLSIDPVTVDISDIVYETDDDFVATVDANGLITPHNYGVAYITAYSKDYQVSKTIQVNVLEKVELVSIKTTLPNYQLSINQTSKVDVSYTPSNTTQKLVTYTSSLPEVATINQQGIITALAVGETVITVSNADGTIESSFTINVVSPVVSIKFNEGIYITGLDAVDNNVDFYPTITPFDATNQNLIWQSSNPEVAYVNAEGILIKLKEGVATLRATVANTTLFDEVIVSVSSDNTQLKVNKLFNDGNYYYALLDNLDILIWGNDLSSSKKITNNTGFNFIDMERFSGNWFIFLTDTYKVKLGYISQNTIVLSSYNGMTNEKLNLISDVKSIHANMDFQSAFILTNSGDVWAFGNNNYGHLGDETTIDRWDNLVQVSIEDVKDLKTTTYSVIFLTNNNQAFITGTSAQYSTPTKVFDNVEFISNQRGFVNISTSTQVHTYYSDSSNPISMNRELNAVHNFAPNQNRYFYIKDGFVYSFGNQNHGELGLGTQNQYEPNYKKIEGVSNVEKLFIFNNNTFIQTENGFFGLGLNASNQLITYDNISRFKPYPIVFGLKGNVDNLTFENNFTEELLDNNQGWENFYDFNMDATHVYYSEISASWWNKSVRLILDNFDGVKDKATIRFKGLLGQTFMFRIQGDGLSKEKSLTASGVTQLVEIDLSDFTEEQRNNFNTFFVFATTQNASGTMELSYVNEAIVSQDWIGNDMRIDFHQSSKPIVEITNDVRETTVTYTNTRHYGSRIVLDLDYFNFERDEMTISYTGENSHLYAIEIKTNQGNILYTEFTGTGSKSTLELDLRMHKSILKAGQNELIIFLSPRAFPISGTFIIENLELTNPTFKLYGESIIFDYNEAIVSSSAYGNISLQNTKTGGLVAIRRSIVLDKLTITPTRPLEVGTVYQLVIPAGALSSKFMVSNERYSAVFEYLGTYDPSLLPENEQAFLEEAKKVETVSTIINNVNVQYLNETYRLTMNVIDTSLPSGVFNLLESLGVSEVSFDSGNTYIALDYSNVSRFIEVIRSAILSSSDSRITLQYKAKIALDGFDPFTADFTAIFNFDSNTTVYEDLVDQALNMEMRLLELSHPDGSSRHLATKLITLTFNNAKASDRFDDIVLKDQNNVIVDSLISLEDNVLTIEAFMPFTQGSSYTYDIPFGALVDDLGNFNQRYENTFKVYEPIRLIRTSISTGDENVSLNQEFRLFYNFAIANNISLITLKDSNNNNVEITTTLINHVLYIKPVTSLLHSETYTLNIPTGVFKDELNVLSQAVSYTFDTIEKETRFFYTSDYVYDLFQTFVAEGKYGSRFINNAILNNFTETNLNNWLRFQGATNSEDILYMNQYGLHGNYFGTDNQEIINKHFIDFDVFQSLIDINPGAVVSAPSNTFPFVVDVQIYDSDGEQHYSYGNQTVKFVVTFNRDMETSIPLDFRFGSSLPFAEYKIEGSYVNPRTWEGTYELRSFVESGNQYFNISNGHAKDKPYLVLGWDVKRFTFIYDTTEAQALSLQGDVDTSGIHLTWIQDDFETIAGYNVYKRLVGDSSFTRVNSSIIPHTISKLTDNDIEPGKLYEYYFTVVLTDFDLITGAFAESDPSGQILIRALDTLEPNIYHTPSYQAFAARNVIISATIVDNVSVTEAFVYFRTVGETTYRKVAMTHLNNRYNGIISAVFVKTEGLEYYIEAFDGFNYQYFGTSEEPVQVQITELVNSSAKGDVNGDGVVNVIDALMILRAINGFMTLTNDEMQRADLNEDNVLSSSEALVILQYAIGKRTTLNMN